MFMRERAEMKIQTASVKTGTFVYFTVDLFTNKEKKIVCKKKSGDGGDGIKTGQKIAYYF